MPLFLVVALQSSDPAIDEAVASKFPETSYKREWLSAQSAKADV
jgi:hypothetical protein